MASLADAPVGRLCREAGPETVVALVADLYAARGWRVDRIADRALAVSDGDRTKTVTVAHPDESTPATAVRAGTDAVVVLDGDAAVPGGVEAIGPETLRRQLAYAIERPVARDLLETHFGWYPDRTEVPPGSVSGDDSGPSDVPATVHGGRGGATAGQSGVLARRVRVLVTAAVVLALVGGVAVALSGGGQPDDGELSGSTTVEPVAVTATTPTDVPSSDQSPPAGTRVTPTATAASPETYPDLPRGIDATGTIDPRRLSETHRARLENTSYRLTLVHREFVDGRLSAIHSETIRVASARKYSARVTHTGSFLGQPRTIAAGEVYADGSARYERLDDGTVERGVLLSSDRFLTDSVFHLYRHLDVRTASVVAQVTEGNTTTSYVATEGNSDPTVKNATGTLRVTETGLIERARWRYDIGGTPSGNPNVSVVFELRVTDVGDTSVPRPDWMSANGTG